MSIWYQYDSVEKDVLIRYVEDNQFHEILHKGDKAWRALYPQPNDNDEPYTRAIWLGGRLLGMFGRYHGTGSRKDT